MTLLNEIKQQIDSHEIISFDIFDTLLLRPYVKPTDLFLHLEKLEELKGFAQARIEAERKARKTHSHLEDITIDEIYNEITDKYKYLKQKEMDLEMQVLQPNPEMKEVYDYALSQNKDIIIVSDMYLTEEFLTKVLHKKGYKNFKKLFVSSTERKTKGRKSLFLHILKQLNTQAEKILHIGDNKKSDYENPKELDISSYHIEKVIDKYLQQNEKAKIFIDKYPNNLEVSVLIMNLAIHFNQNQNEDFWARIGYEYGGPMCYAYMKWIEQNVLKRNIKEILFVARDGYTLKKVFDLFEHKDIKTHYIYAPRQVFTNCFIDKAIEYGRSLSILYGYKNKDKEINEAYSNIKTTSQATTFIKNKYALFKQYESEARKEYSNYIKNLNIKNNDIAIVDTISSNCSSIQLISYNIKNKIYSYFWNTLKHIKPYQKKFSINTYNSKYYPNNILCWDFYEYMMTSVEAPIIDLKNGKPIFTDKISIYEKNRLEIYPIIINSIINFANSLCKNISFSEEIITNWINLLFSNPNYEEKKQLSSLQIATDSSHKAYRSMYTKWYEKNDNINNYNKRNYYIFGIPILKIKEITYKHNFDQQSKIKIKLLNIPIIKIIKNQWLLKLYLFGLKMLSYKQKENESCLRIIGLPFYKKLNNELLSDKEGNNSDHKLLLNINRIIEKKLSTFSIHQNTFSKFKNINKGKDIVIVATGPSLNKYRPIDNAIHLGVNRAISFNKIHYDYYFVQDYSGATPTYIKDIVKYDNCIKFFGLTSEETSPDKIIPESYLDEKDIYRYRTDWEAIPNFKTKFTYDLSSISLGCGGTVVLPAIQFALWTRAKRIYLVGCDTNTSGYFNNDDNNQLDVVNIIQRYKEIKDFAQQYYPDVEIISVNPVGLKGIFKDLYQND